MPSEEYDNLQWELQQAQETNEKLVKGVQAALCALTGLSVEGVKDRLQELKFEADQKIISLCEQSHDVERAAQKEFAEAERKRDQALAAAEKIHEESDQNSELWRYLNAVEEALGDEDDDDEDDEE